MGINCHKTDLEICVPLMKLLERSSTVRAYETNCFTVRSGLAVTLWTRIREVLSSNVVRDSQYPD
jgi:hypothetical protein